MTKIEITTFIIALAGALAWVPLVINFLKKSLLKGRVVGLTISESYHFSSMNHFTNTKEVLEGIGYFPNFTFISLHKDFNVQKVDVSVKYPGESELREGTLFIASKIEISFKGNESMTKFLNIPTEEHVSSLLVLERGKPTHFFITFVVNKQTFEHFEYINVKFTDFNGQEQVVKFDQFDFDVKKMRFDKKYWSKK